MLFVFPSQKDFVLAFRRGEVPSGAERFTPTDSPANFPEDPPILPIDSAIEPLLGHGVSRAIPALRSAITARIHSFNGKTSVARLRPDPAPRRFLKSKQVRLEN